MQYLKFDLSKPDWCNPEVLERNRIPARSFVQTYAGADAARAAYSSPGYCADAAGDGGGTDNHGADMTHTGGDTDNHGADTTRVDGDPGDARLISLNGQWKFAFVESPYLAPADFFSPQFDDSGWDILDVPSEWEFSGYGRPHYTDSLSIFPVAGRPFPSEYNPTGLYRRVFESPEAGLCRALLRFEGVESGFHVWVNGREAGYSQGSRLVSEFDITSLLKKGENLLVVRVYKFTDGSYLENQDMWWLAGIFRDVALLCRPFTHFTNVRADCLLQKDGSGLLDVQVECKCVGECDGEGECGSDGEGVGDGKGECDGEVECKCVGECDGEGECEIECDSGLEPVDCRVDVELSYDGALIWSCGETLGAKAVYFRHTLPDVLPWSAESPHLYQLLLILSSGGKTLEALPLRLGFKRVEIECGLIKINGAALRFKGVNYHLWDPCRGRAADPQRIKEDLIYLKRQNVNAIRTSHYPQADVFYDLCDELGLYVLDEADLECSMCQLYDQPNQFSDDPYWEAAYIDRVHRTVVRNLNRACVVMWSLGNESGYGRNFAAAYRHVKLLDQTRPIHYEEDRSAKTADLYSSMYSSVQRLADLGRQDKDKPHVMCEYGHAMGNGPGSLEEYWELFYKYPRLQGGFLWEYRDHTILRMDPDGKLRVCYGGDFGDEPNNGDFCASGLVQGNGRPTPGMAQVKHALSPIRAEELDTAGNRVLLWNRSDFTPLDSLYAVCRAEAGGLVIAASSMSLPAVPPGQKQWVTLPPGLFPPGIQWLTLRFFWAAPPFWAQHCDEVDVCQFKLEDKATNDTTDSEPVVAAAAHEPVAATVVVAATAVVAAAHAAVDKPEPATANESAAAHEPATAATSAATAAAGEPEPVVAAVDISADDATITMTVAAFGGPSAATATATATSTTTATATAASPGVYTLSISTVTGTIQDYRIDGMQLMGPADMCFYRAPIQNDINQNKQWKHFGLDHMQGCLLSLEANAGEGVAAVTAHKRYAPYTMNWYIDVVMRYTLDSIGRLTIEADGTPVGALPPTLARIGLRAVLYGGLERVAWLGRGPGECYRDSKQGCPFGLYIATVDDLHFPYVVPQDNGNRTDVEWVRFTGDGYGLLIKPVGALSFSAHHYSLEDCVIATHDVDLPRRDEIYLHLDHAHHGLGSAGWGPEALPEYSLRPEPFRFVWQFSCWKDVG